MSVEFGRGRDRQTSGPRSAKLDRGRPNLDHLEFLSAAAAGRWVRCGEAAAGHRAAWRLVATLCVAAVDVAPVGSGGLGRSTPWRQQSPSVAACCSGEAHADPPPRALVRPTRGRRTHPPPARPIAVARAPRRWGLRGPRPGCVWGGGQLLWWRSIWGSSLSMASPLLGGCRVGAGGGWRPPAAPPSLSASGDRLRGDPMGGGDAMGVGPMGASVTP